MAKKHVDQTIHMDEPPSRIKTAEPRKCSHLCEQPWSNPSDLCCKCSRMEPWNSCELCRTRSYLKVLDKRAPTITATRRPSDRLMFHLPCASHHLRTLL